MSQFPQPGPRDGPRGDLPPRPSGSGPWAFHPPWRRYRVNFEDFSAAALAASHPLFTLPARSVIQGVIIRPVESFTGGLIASYTLSVGVTGAPAKYGAAFNVLQSPGATVFGLSNIMGMEDFENPTVIRARAVAVGANLNQATAGAALIHVLWSTLS